jgi:hypothetical protein
MSRDGEKGKENGATVEDDAPRPFLGTSLIKYMVKSSSVEGGETANVKMSKGAAKLLEEFYRLFVVESVHRSISMASQVEEDKSAARAAAGAATPVEEDEDAEDTLIVDPEHLERALPQLLLDF